MSGPKVINVVSRQQQIDTCKAAIAEVDYALVEWQRIMDRNMIVAPAELARFTGPRDYLQTLFAADRFHEVQVLAAALVISLRESVQHHLAAQNSEAVRRQRQEHSLRLSAETVLARAREKQLELPEESIQVLAEAAAGRSVQHEVVQRALSQATVALYAQPEDQPSRTQLELARLLGATQSPVLASEMLTDAEESLRDPRLARVSSQITDLEAVGEIEEATAFSVRLDRVHEADAAGDTRQRELLLASLEIEIGPAVAKARLRNDLRREIGVELASAQVTDYADAVQTDLQKAEAALERGDPYAARVHIEQAKKLRLEKQKQRAAQSSRAAILDGLKELGYEVREGMATQWAEKNQLVVRHAAKPGVALELAGTLDGGRLQARMVALQGSARDPHADKQTEEKWCSELDSLQKYVAGRGGEIRVVKAVAAGAAPLKIVADDQMDDEKREQRLKERRV
jgi:hypothetical protein